MSVLPVQSTTQWWLKGQADGFTEEYKDPPVPRRLVRQSQVPPYLSPAYTDLGSFLSRTWLARGQGEFRTGSKTGFQLRRLPVRPERGQDQTHTRALTVLNNQDLGNIVRSGVSGLGVHVPHRSTHSNRKTSPSRSAPYDTYTVTLEEQLEGTRVTRKGDTLPRSLHPHLKWWLEESNVLPGQQLHPLKHALQIFTDASKEGWSAHLNKGTAKGTWSILESKLHINHLELKAVFLALKEFQDLCLNNIVLIATDNTTVVAYINKAGGEMKSGPLCALLWRILTWCDRKQVTLKARHMPGWLKMIADKLSRLGQTIQIEWSLHPEVFQAICSRWHQPQLDLFATRFNNKLPQFITGSRPPGLCSGCTQSWEDLDPYTFPPAAILGKGTLNPKMRGCVYMNITCVYLVYST